MYSYLRKELCITWWEGGTFGHDLGQRIQGGTADGCIGILQELDSDRHDALQPRLIVLHDDTLQKFQPPYFGRRTLHMSNRCQDQMNVQYMWIVRGHIIAHIVVLGSGGTCIFKVLEDRLDRL
jgi:hypothetical protein